MAGLAPANIRIAGPEGPLPSDPATVLVEFPEDGADIPEIDDAGNVLRLKHGDGSLTISLDGKPLDEAVKKEPLTWFSNLADEIDEGELSGICEDLLRGIAADEESRREWIENRALGEKLLGLKIELPNVQGASDGAPVEGMSKVRHPLLLEAVLRFQANARSELLPTDGPVKVRNDSNDDTLKTDPLANALELDMNFYLTSVASEYYPDTDRMLMSLGLAGTTFKKVYFCPLRNRPVSESVDAADIIVNEQATDLENAIRVTHRTYLKQSTVRRLQILDVYRDVELSDPVMPQLDSLQEEQKSQQGLSPSSTLRPEDRNREIYECDCELDIKGYEHKIKGKETGLALPYTVTIDKSSRKILALRRNYNEEDEKLPTARRRYVQYTFVPGFGFLGIGLLNILGNSTNAVTAAWRELLDSGMYANFPGFLVAKAGARQNSLVIRVPPGGGAQIDTGGVGIKDAVAPLPYQTSGMGPLMALVENIVETGQRVGGTAELQVGEGRESQPVGTTMALIDQAIKILSSVHKRLHASQDIEFKLLLEVFREHPESFWQKKTRSKTAWDVATFMQAISNVELVPRSDPNTSSQGHRAMKTQALVQIQQMFPTLIDPLVVVKTALQAVGWAHPEQFLVPPAAQSAPPPQLVQQQQETAAKMQTAKAKETEAQARMVEAQGKAAESKAKVDLGHFAPKGESAPEQAEQESSLDVINAQAKLMDSQTKAKDVGLKAQELGLKAHELRLEDQNRDQDRAAKEKDAAIGLAKDLLKAPAGGGGAGPDGKPKAKPKPLATPENVGEKTGKILKDVDNAAVKD